MKQILILTLTVVMLASAPSLYAVEISTTTTQKKTPKKNRRLETVVYRVHLDCESCKKKIVEHISFEKGVRGLSISLEDQMVKVTFDARKTDSIKIANAINKLGYKIEK